MLEKKKRKGRRKLMDLIVTLTVALILGVCYFLWGCELDLVFTVLCLVLLILGSVALYKQNRKLDELYSRKN